MSTETSDPRVEPREVRPTDVDEPQVTAEADAWYASPFGIGVVGLDVALMLALAASTTNWGDHLVPWEVYMFGALGALGYVFRSLLHGFDQSVREVLQANVQVLAALPLAAGIYLFADLAHPAEPNLEFVAGVSFVVGLFVDLAYQALAKIANRVLSQGLGRGTAGNRRPGAVYGRQADRDRPPLPRTDPTDGGADRRGGSADDRDEATDGGETSGN